jgi:hypothetical protein
VISDREWVVVSWRRTTTHIECHAPVSGPPRLRRDHRGLVRLRDRRATSAASVPDARRHPRRRDARDRLPRSRPRTESLVPGTRYEVLGREPRAHSREPTIRTRRGESSNPRRVRIVGSRLWALGLVPHTWYLVPGTRYEVESVEGGRGRRGDEGAVVHRAPMQRQWLACHEGEPGRDDRGEGAVDRRPVRDILCESSFAAMKQLPIPCRRSPDQAHDALSVCPGAVGSGRCPLRRALRPPLLTACFRPGGAYYSSRATSDATWSLVTPDV